MATKPTYEELVRKVATLEAEKAERIRAEKDLLEVLQLAQDPIKNWKGTDIPSLLQFLKGVLSAVPDLLLVIDRNYNIVFSNYKGHNFVDTPCADQVQTCYGRFKQRDKPCQECSAEPVFEHGKGVTMEMINPVDGRLREVRAFPIFDLQGQVCMVVEYVRDINDFRQVQDESFKRQQFLESLLYHAPDAIVTLDANQRVVDWNRGAVDMFGYAPDEAIGAQLDDLVARGEHHAEAIAKTRMVLSGQRVEAYETVRYRKDGAPLRVIVAGSPIIVGGVLKGVVAVYTDVTSRVRTEAALRESEARFRTFVELSPLGISLITRDGRYQYINPQFQLMFGYTLEDIPTGSDWFQKAFPDESKREQAVNLWHSDLRQTNIGQCRPRTFTVTCKDGSRKMIHFRSVTMENMEQFVIYEDITEKVKLERQFLQAQKFEALGTLSGGIAHDFNNLLMGIQGRVSLMAVNVDPSHPHWGHINAIEDYISSAAGLTRQLLGFARGGKYEVHPIDVNTLLKESAALFGRTQKEIRIHYALQDPSPVVAADKRQLEQVLLNIYVNAWQAMPEGGTLYLETVVVTLDADTCEPHQATPGQYAKLVITDTGIGMSAETRQRIFDPFFTTKAKGRGTGLGLASAYGIVKNHEGFITVYSEIGQGSSFNIYLPLSNQEAYPDVKTKSGLVKGTETILLVDDEEMITEVGRQLLEVLGYRVLVASGGEPAIELIRTRGNEIDLIILDLIMPGMDGGKTFEQIRDIRPRIPVMLSSGYSLNGQAQDIMNSGCNGFIQKPFNIFDLSRMIRKVLDESRNQPQKDL